MFDWLGDIFSGGGGDPYGGASWPDESVSYDPGVQNAEIGGGDWMRIAQTAGQIFSDTPGTSVARMPGVMPAAFPAMGALGGMAAAAGRTLASLFGGAARAATFNINGIRGTLPQLWKYTRRYGPAAVAQAMGITVGALGAMLLSAPDAGRSRRRRGISARDIRTTKRVVGFVSKMANTIGCVRAPRHFRRSKRR